MLQIVVEILLLFIIFVKQDISSLHVCNQNSNIRMPLNPNLIIFVNLFRKIFLSS